MADHLRPTSLRCEYLVNPLAIDTENPRLSWILNSSQRGHRQAAYRLLAASTQQALLEQHYDLWDSGRVESSETTQIRYAGSALAAGLRCWWSVTVWDTDGASVTSEPAWWERGLAAADWHGQWIGMDAWNGLHMPSNQPPGEEEAVNPALPGLIPSPYLRTTIQVDGPVHRARLHVTARGVYELRINGARAGDQLLAPGWTDYDRRIQYQSYDVTELLTQGENALGAILGSGWYCGYTGFDLKCRNYGTRPQLLLEGCIEYEDGRVQIVRSDESWKTSTGPILYADMQMGESVDARLTQIGWDRAGFADDTWRPVSVEPLNGVLLVADRAEPVQVIQELTPVALSEPSAGTYIFDLGQNIAGWVRLRIQGNAGTQIQLRFAEILDADGTLYTENLRSAIATDRFVLAGGDEEIFEPHFTFHGFRYVELTGASFTPELNAIIGCVVASNTPAAGSFTCSSELVNQLQRNIEWGQRGNFLSVPTDCPQRDERLGWMGDAQVFIRTAACNADVAAFFSKWMADVVDAQSSAGGFPDVAPRMSAWQDGAPAWADAGVIIPWTIYTVYGDVALVREHYSAMKRWMEYLLQGNPGYLRLGRLNASYGDWLAIGEHTPIDVLATAYWALDARLMAIMARAIGECTDADRFEEQYARIKAAFIAAYVDSEGHVAGDTQTGYVMALQMDLVPAALRATAAGHLVATIERRGWHLATGFVGVGYLCPLLSATGHLDVAYRLLLNDTFPSWGYSIRHGATTIWERWDGWTEEHGFQDPGMNSFNHYSLGSVGEWLYRVVAGIDTDSATPGFRHMLIRPRPGGGLTYARASYRAITGDISTDWSIDSGVFRLAVTLPANTEATVHLPATPDATVAESGIPLGSAVGVRVLTRTADELILAVESGSYVFQVHPG